MSKIEEAIVRLQNTAITEFGEDNPITEIAMDKTTFLGFMSSIYRESKLWPKLDPPNAFSFKYRGINIVHKSPDATQTPNTSVVSHGLSTDEELVELVKAGFTHSEKYKGKSAFVAIESFNTGYRFAKSQALSTLGDNNG